MQFQEFITEVQKKAQLSTPEKAELTTKATLETLGERLAGGAPANLGSHLPQQVRGFLESRRSKGERFSREEFFQRVAQKERSNVPEATDHARAVMSVVADNIDPGQMEKVRSQLPDEFHELLRGGSDAHSEGHAGIA